MSMSISIHRVTAVQVEQRMMPADGSHDRNWYITTLHLTTVDSLGYESNHRIDLFGKDGHPVRVLPYRRPEVEAGEATHLPEDPQSAMLD